MSDSPGNYMTHDQGPGDNCAEPECGRAGWLAVTVVSGQDKEVHLSCGLHAHSIADALGTDLAPGEFVVAPLLGMAPPDYEL